MKTSRWYNAFAVAFCVFTGACDNKNQAQNTNETVEQAKADQPLMADPARAGPELERRLAISPRRPLIALPV